MICCSNNLHFVYIVKNEYQSKNSQIVNLAFNFVTNCIKLLPVIQVLPSNGKGLLQILIIFWIVQAKKLNLRHIYFVWIQYLNLSLREVIKVITNKKKDCFYIYIFNLTIFFGFKENSIFDLICSWWITFSTQKLQ